MFKQFVKRSGFTLSEVLITLGIIGVVAALTIPSLMNKTQNQEFVTALKKNYSVFSQAYKLILDDGGEFPDFQGDGDVIVKFASKMKFIKTCDGSNITDCWSDESPLALNNSDTAVFYLDFVGAGEQNMGILADGTSVGAFNLDPDCAYVQGDGPLQNVCAQLYIDVNGRKRPNIIGRDVFAFAIAKTGIFPDGVYNGIASDGSGLATCATGDKGYNDSTGCTAKVIQDGKMNY